MNDEESAPLGVWLGENSKLFMLAASRDLIVERCMKCGEISSLDFKSKLCAMCRFKAARRNPSSSLFLRLKG